MEWPKCEWDSAEDKVARGVCQRLASRHCGGRGRKTNAYVCEFCLRNSRFLSKYYFRSHRLSAIGRCTPDGVTIEEVQRPDEQIEQETVALGLYY